MKKQIFLLSGLLFAGQVTQSNTNSCSPCATSCNTTCETSCNSCGLEHGKTRRDVTPHFQNASPELTSMFNSHALSNLIKDDKHGAFELTVFGGKSTKCSQAASYFLPYGNSTLTFDGSIQKARGFARVAAESVAQATTGVAAGDQAFPGSTNTTILVDPATYYFDANKDTSKILPWNFGITFAALFEPRGASATPGIGSLVGSGLITSPAFKSTIAPTYRYSHVGAGLDLRYHFSDDKNGWFGFLSTSVQFVRSKFCLNEDVINEALVMDDAFFAGYTNNPTGSAPAVAVTAATTNGLNTFAYPSTSAATVAPKGSLKAAYFNTGFPNTVSTQLAGAPANVPAPTNVTQAFAQDAWNYGKVGCEQKITRLADIELALGYQWMCGDCAATNWYVGLVIPTGNKACATYIAPAVVGNGQHFGIMTGSQTDVMLSDEEDYQAWFRLDINARYLFRNTQRASFDLLGNEWSRYMMVWADKAAYTAAVAAANTITAGAGVAYRAYTPGINVFTTDFYIKPQFQARLNSAVFFQGEHFRAELGWNTFARQKDCVQLACGWNEAPAFADSSYVAGVGLNNNRTIYNDSQTTAYNAVTSLTRINPAAAPQTLTTIAFNDLSDAQYEDFAISSSEINLDSVATPAAITNTPYLALGYAWESDYKPALSIGGSYEIASGNSALNQWLVWGKFEIAF